MCICALLSNVFFNNLFISTITLEQFKTRVKIITNLLIDKNRVIGFNIVIRKNFVLNNFLTRINTSKLIFIIFKDIYIANKHIQAIRIQLLCFLSSLALSEYLGFPATASEKSFPINLLPP
jgi:hypothetical protein